MPRAQRASVLVIGGGRSRSSRTRGLLETATAIVEECGATPEVWDVGTVNHKQPGGARQAPQPSGLRAMATRAHALILVTPTYHGSYSGLIKHSLDQLDPAVVSGKPVALMATCGPVPTPQALDHLRIVAGALGATTIPSQVVAGEADFRMLGESYVVADELLLERVRATVVELVWFAQRLGAPGGALRNGDSPRLQADDLPEQIARAAEYVRENFTNGRLSLDRVAREACMSRSHFSRTFKRATGTRFMDFVTDLRMAEARALLAESDRSITGIALAVGYRDLSPFERAFKKQFGLAPSQYRKRVRAGADA